MGALKLWHNVNYRNSALQTCTAESAPFLLTLGHFLSELSWCNRGAT